MMKVEEHISLKAYTTIKIGGTAKRFYKVENLEDIKEVIRTVGDNYLILANGSNLLINDKREFDNVIYMNSYKKVMEYEDDIIEVSSSVKVQELINYINKNGQGGIEYLYSVPATVGGAIFMNAGRGKAYNKAISDYIVNVKILDGDEVRVLNKEECKFGYRKSIFQDKKYIILSAKFRFDKVSKEDSTDLKKERVEYSKKYLDSTNKSAGSVFKVNHPKIMNLLKKIGLGWKNGASYSKKTSNWINNNGNGTYTQVKTLVFTAKMLHKIFMKEIELEYIEWK